MYRFFNSLIVSRNSFINGWILIVLYVYIFIMMMMFYDNQYVTLYMYVYWITQYVVLTVLYPIKYFFLINNFLIYLFLCIYIASSYITGARLIQEKTTPYYTIKRAPVSYIY